MDMIINRLPSPTWNRLKMNQVKLSADIKSNAKIDLDMPKEISYSLVENSGFNNISTGVGKDLSSLINEAKISTHKFTLDDNKNITSPLRLNFLFENKEEVASILEFDIKENSKMTVIMDYSTVENATGFAAIQTKINLEKNAGLHLIQVQRIKDSFTFVNDIGSINKEASEFKLTKLILGGESTFDGLMVDLVGNKSSFTNDLAYVVKGNDKLDINYIIKHKGKKTESNIDVKGVLKDNAYKIFRGTIDIEKGAINASGKENEAVLLIDDDVINKSIPVILCAEEDVEGAHGASIGRLDDEILLYMKSRGIPEEEIYKIMAKARIEELCHKIGDEKTVSLIHDFLGGNENVY